MIKCRALNDQLNVFADDADLSHKNIASTFQAIVDWHARGEILPLS